MIPFPTFLAFVVTALVIIAIPGPSVLFVIARSINLGVRGGLISVCGVACGALAHAIAVTLGLARLLQVSPTAFLVVKNLGCFYLLFLGLRTLFAKAGESSGAEPRGRHSARQILLQGFLVELLNPKTALFFLAFLPQFTSTTQGSISRQLFLLGLTFVLLGLLSDGIYAISASRIGAWLKRSKTFRKVEKYASGSVYLGLGLSGLFSRVPRNP